jgi:hypothetical protein
MWHRAAARRGDQRPVFAYRLEQVRDNLIEHDTAIVRLDR